MRSTSRGRLVRRWWGMARGRSYWHRAQGIGRLFVPDQLAGYAIDLTAKVPYPGPFDHDGAPLAIMPTGRLAAFPTTVFQLALGHWDLWLASERRDRAHLAAFRRLCDWACAKQDARGGWPIYPILNIETASPYSALSQGQGVSCLVRAASVVGEERYSVAAAHGFECLVTSVAAGGTARPLPNGGLVLEEYPVDPPVTVLNGWIFALLALHDAALLKLPQAGEAFAAAEAALADGVPHYDAGLWSLYDTSGNWASPFYQQLHIAQLTVLERLRPERNAYRHYRRRWSRQLASVPNTAFAVGWKALQQLRRPPPQPLR